MENYKHIVEFDKYCKTCKHRDLDEVKDPCHECLSEPINEGTTKPIKYEADEKLVEEEKKGEVNNNDNKEN